MHYRTLTHTHTHTHIHPLLTGTNWDSTITTFTFVHSYWCSVYNINIYTRQLKTRTITMQPNKITSSVMIIGTALFAMTIIAIVPGSSAISCWECNSETNRHCFDVEAGAVENISKIEPCFREMYKECSLADGQQPFCRTQEQTIQGKKRVIRSCAHERASEDCYATKTPSVHTKVCQCFTDGCNSSGSLFANTIMIVIVTITGMLVVFNWSWYLEHLNNIAFGK